MAEAIRFSARLLVFLLPRIPEASKQMNQSWGQLVMFDSLYTQVNEHVEAAASLLAGGMNKPVTVDMKRTVRKEHIDQTWENALITNKMSNAADKSRRAAEEARRNAAVGIIQVPRSPTVVLMFCSDANHGMMSKPALPAKPCHAGHLLHYNNVLAGMLEALSRPEGVQGR